MVDFPQSVQTHIAAALDANPSDVEAATEQALRAIQQMREYPALIEQIVRQAVKTTIYQLRHARNVAARNATSSYAHTPRQTPAGASARVDRIAASLYDMYYLGGRVLGSILGSELGNIAANEQAKADGHLFNVRLCQALKKLVRSDQTVRQAVSERRLRNLFTKLQQDLEEAA